ncbi:MAG: TatD family hydrolase [Ilumatobacteraceae bacterium]
MTYTDSHCHLYDTRGVAIDDVIAAARAAGVTTMINVGCDAATTEQAIAVSASHDGIFATAGLHPHEAKHGVDTIVPYLDDPNIIAIGECGLDYFYDHSPRDTQRDAFAAQIQLARQRSLPLVIHTRDAWAETFDILDAEGTPERTIFHCFTGGADEARQCLERGAYLSFSGIVTFKTATDLHEAARLCPIDRVLAETDSPYLAPVPHRGKPNQPAFVTHVVQALADLRRAPLDDVRAATVANACLAFPGIRP